jgi:hypothetical protein
VRKKIHDFTITFNAAAVMGIARILEILLILILLRALVPVFVRFLRRWFFGQGGGGAERFKEERFDKGKADIEDGEFKELK